MSIPGLLDSAGSSGHGPRSRHELRRDGGIVVGNRFDKHGSHNPLVRRLVEGFDRSLERLLDAVGPVERVLEVGCGEGHVTARLARHFPLARLLGTDLSPRIIDVARHDHPGIAFERCSVYDLAALGTWDLVVACEVFEHLADPARALREVAAASRGHVIVTVPREPIWRLLNVARGHYLGALGNTEGHLQHWSRRSFLRFVSGSVDVVQVRTPLPWTQVLARPRPLAAALTDRMQP